MDKELIKKYKKEFNHWLNGGSIIHKTKSSNMYYRDTIQWTKGINDIESIIINDEYVKFRKALAEGKTVEILPNKCGNTTYKAINPLDLTEYSLEDIRIRPEESQFKVGDWVINSFFKGNLTPFQITEDMLNNSNTWKFYTQKWKPQLDEWCWFYDDESKSARLAQFKKITSSGIHTGKYQDRQGNNLDNCEPYIVGEYPSHLKGKINE